MSSYATKSPQRGAALVSVMIVFVGLFGLSYATVMRTRADVLDSRHSIDHVRTRYIAESGYERARDVLGAAIQKIGSGEPMGGLNALFAGGTTATLFTAEPLMQGAAEVGAFTVTLEKLAETSTSMQIVIRSTGYMAAPAEVMAAGGDLANWQAIAVTLEYSQTPSGVFDYAYFVNNWGWFYGNTIYAWGNVRSNGQFDVAGYSPTVGGQPTYDSVSWDGAVATLSGYHDDNGDGFEDGEDGGVWSGWDIAGVEHLDGNGGLVENQHDFQEQLEMPNLSDLTSYKAQALADNTSLSVGGVEVSDAVFGDEPGETGNLYLVGTAAEPIQLNGSIVVEGDVIISGYVTGQGAIYAGGNVYCPDSVEYLNGATTPKPTGGTQAESEAWLSDNWNKDFLGLFAKENIVVGDYTNSTWRTYVGSWMGSALNQSAEDAGEDGIPNTHAGLDGIEGTADDDVLEGDGVWTVEYYSQADAELGLIPAGSAVGDPIPGSGEDIDGDGQFDAATTLDDLALGVALNTDNWGGNMPAEGVANYSDIATLTANRLDAVFYTNHSFCQMVQGSDPFVINGALVSRNENVVYATPSFEINYDARLLGRSGGVAGQLLPYTVSEPLVLQWELLSRDPNRFVGVQP